MAVKLRLRRLGRSKRPLFGLVATDSRSPRDGRFIEDLGRYNPLSEPATIELNTDRILYWLDQGAQPSDTVRSILSKEGVMLRHYLTGRGKEAAEIDEAVKAHQEARQKKAESTIKTTARQRRVAALAAEAKLAAEKEAELAKARAEAEEKARAEAEAAKRKAAEEVEKQREAAKETAKVEQEEKNVAQAEADAALDQSDVDASAADAETSEDAEAAVEQPEPSAAEAATIEAATPETESQEAVDQAASADTDAAPAAEAETATDVETAAEGDESAAPEPVAEDGSKEPAAAEPTKSAKDTASKKKK